MDQARSVHSLSLVWTKAHTKQNSMVANGNRKADSLALLGRRSLARSLGPVDLLVPRRPLKRHSAVVSLDRPLVPSKRTRLTVCHHLRPLLFVCTLPDSMRPPPSGWRYCGWLVSDSEAAPRILSLGATGLATWFMGSG